MFYNKSIKNIIHFIFVIFMFIIRYLPNTYILLFSTFFAIASNTEPIPVSIPGKCYKTVHIFSQRDSSEFIHTLPVYIYYWIFTFANLVWRL
jgi:hypothetical protein